MKMTQMWRERCENAENEEELDKILDEWQIAKDNPKPEIDVEEKGAKKNVYFGVELNSCWKRPPESRREAISWKKCELAIEKELKEKEERRKRGEVIDDDDD